MNNENNIINEHSSLDNSLIIRYLQDATSHEETLLVEEWISKSEENIKEIEHLAEIYFTKRAYDRMASRNVNLAFQKVKPFLYKKKKISWQKSLLYAAASFIGAILISSVYIYLHDMEKVPGKLNYVQIQANLGVRTSLTLSDETVVHLNSGSTFTYPEKFGKEQRQVKLEGEAFFQVKRDTERPFIVNTNDGRASIEVLGTSFNVQCFDNDNEFTTTLSEGLVNVTLRNNDGTEIFRQLSPADKIVFNKQTDSLTIVKVDPETETAWINGRLIFRNLPMPQVLKILSYNYNVEFDVKNPAINSYHFTGTFQDRQLSQILEYLKISSDITYTISYPNADDSFEIRKTKVTLN